MSSAGIVYVVVFGIVATFIGWQFEKRKIKRHQAKLAQLRPNFSDQEFAGHFAPPAVNADISLWLRVEIDGYKYAETVRVHWDDEIWNFYRIDGEEIELILERFCEKFGFASLDSSNPETVPQLITIEDLVLYAGTLSKRLAAKDGFA